MIQVKDKIIDYEKHKDEIDYWIALKGEKKYLEFIKILEKNSVDITWLNLNNIYRYDKRLLVNIFKYLSFYEEYLRAQVWNASEETYEEIEKSFFIGVMNKVIKLKDNSLKKMVDDEKLSKDKDGINELRRSACHDKIMLNCVHKKMDLEALLISFKNNLPINYRRGFVTDINKCETALHLDPNIKIAL